MKTLVWAGFALLLALWTGGTWVVAELLRWGTGALAGGEVVDAARTAAEWPVPAWLALWLDPSWLRAAQAGVLWALEAARDGLPFLHGLVAWLVPLLWVGWGLGAALLLLLAAGAHLMVARLVAPRAPAPA